MDESMATGKAKAEFVADVLNKMIYTLVTNCTKSDEVRNYFDIGVIGYGGHGVGPGLGAALNGSIMNPIAVLATSPLRVENRTRLEDDGAGGVIERRIKFPVWFDPTSSGETPMCAGLTKAAEALVEWCDTHPNCYCDRWRVNRWRPRDRCFGHSSAIYERRRMSVVQHPHFNAARRNCAIPGHRRVAAGSLWEIAVSDVKYTAIPRIQAGR
jgi:hypothetical protein